MSSLPEPDSRQEKRLLKDEDGFVVIGKLSMTEAQRSRSLLHEIGKQGRLMQLFYDMNIDEESFRETSESEGADRKREAITKFMNFIQGPEPEAEPLTTPPKVDTAEEMVLEDIHQERPQTGGLIDADGIAYGKHRTLPETHIIRQVDTNEANSVANTGGVENLNDRVEEKELPRKLYSPIDIQVPIRIALVYCLRCNLADLPLKGSIAFWTIVGEVIVAVLKHFQIITPDSSVEQTGGFKSLCALCRDIPPGDHIRFAAIAILTGCIHGFQTGNSRQLVLDNDYKQQETFESFLERIIGKAKEKNKKGSIDLLLKQRTQVNIALSLERNDKGIVINEHHVRKEGEVLNVKLETFLKDAPNDKWKYWIFGRALINLGTTDDKGKSNIVTVLNIIQIIAALDTQTQLPTDLEYRTNVSGGERLEKITNGAPVLDKQGNLTYNWKIRGF